MWQPKLLALWRSSGIEGSMEWEMLYMLLFKRLVKDAFFGRANAGVVDWSRLLPTVFSRTLLLLNLPGGTGPVHPKGSSFTNAATALLPSIYPSAMATLRAAARILVLSLPPLPRNPEQLPHPDMVQMAESDGPEAPEARRRGGGCSHGGGQAEVNAAAAATAAATPFADDGLERMVVGDGDGGPLAWISCASCCAAPSRTATHPTTAAGRPSSATSCRPCASSFHGDVRARANSAMSFYLSSPPSPSPPPTLSRVYASSSPISLARPSILCSCAPTAPL